MNKTNATTLESEVLREDVRERLEVAGLTHRPPQHVVTGRDVDMGWILAFMLAFGLIVGITFPWVIASTIDWKPGQEPVFRLACVIAGLSVGGFAYGVARFTLYRTNRHLAHLAVFDPLTGLVNQRYFFHLLRGELARSVRRQSTASLIIADLDHFKRTNDEHGHMVGNEVLAKIGATLLDTIRTYDSACRIGGEEFAVILPDTDKEGAYVLAERIRAAVATITDLELPPVTVSLGIAVFPEDADTLKELVTRADDAMYAAKEAGRNTTRTWDPTHLGIVARD
ncbi:MAG: GGDEF domain-containing protein [Thermoleophilia bacterium]